MNAYPGSPSPVPAIPALNHEVGNDTVEDSAVIERHTVLFCVAHRVFPILRSSGRSIKFAAPMGALSGNSLQVILPAVVSIIALGPAPGAVAGFAAVAALVVPLAGFVPVAAFGVVLVGVWGAVFAIANVESTHDNPILRSRFCMKLLLDLGNCTTTGITLPARCICWLTFSTSPITRSRLPPRIFFTSSGL